MKKVNDISPEHFIAEHFFVYTIKGTMNLFDGSEHRALKAGDGCIARKNRLGRIHNVKENDELEKVIIALEEEFLKVFQEKHRLTATKFTPTNTFIQLERNNLLPYYIDSLQPYYSHGNLKEPFGDVKREELLLILLQAQPELAGLFFDYGIPGKINIEEFMSRNYQFNISIERFAFLTGRSLSAFKRDFKQTFNETPSRWLVLKRLQEAHFLIEKKHKKPSEIYIDLGFETLSHFSFAFKAHFGVTPTALAEQAAKNHPKKRL